MSAVTRSAKFIHADSITPNPCEGRDQLGREVRHANLRADRDGFFFSFDQHVGVLKIDASRLSLQEITKGEVRLFYSYESGAGGEGVCTVIFRDAIKSYQMQISTHLLVKD